MIWAEPTLVRFALDLWTNKIRMFKSTETNGHPPLPQAFELMIHELVYFHVLRVLTAYLGDPMSTAVIWP